MELSPQRIDQLLQSARQGDADARAELFRHFRARLIHIVALRMDTRLRGRIDPSDVVQEALAEAHQHLDGYLDDRPLPFFLWLRKLTCNHLVDLYRQHVVAQKRSVLREEVSHPALPDESAVELADRLAADSTSPSSAAQQGELRLRVLTLLQELSDNDREILTLRYLEGLTVEEIAAVLDLSVSAVKVRHFRAVERLRQRLDPQEDGNG